MSELGANQLRQVDDPARQGRQGPRPATSVRDLTVDVALAGEFEASYTAGDNALVIATDTMKNTVYAFAPDHLTRSIEAFGLVLGRHFVASHQVATRHHHAPRAPLGAARRARRTGPRRLLARRRGRPGRHRSSRRATGAVVESGVTDLS